MAGESVREIGLSSQIEQQIAKWLVLFAVACPPSVWLYINIAFIMFSKLSPHMLLVFTMSLSIKLQTKNNLLKAINYQTVKSLKGLLRHIISTTETNDQ